METARNVARMFGQLLVISLGVVTAAALFGDVHPMLHRFAHFPHIFALCALLLAGLLYIPSRRFAAAAAVVFVLNAVPLVRYAPWSPPCAPEFTVLTINALNDLSDHDALVERLRQDTPDILWICQLDPGLLAKARVLYPHVVFDETYPEVALLTRFPLREAHHRTSKLGRPHIEAVVETPKGPLRVFGVHAMAPFADRLSIDRDESLARIAADVTASDEPAIVLGDFNNTMFAPTFRPLEEAGLINARLGRGIAPTWPSEMPLRIPIDHVVTTDDLKTCDIEVGASFGSDHLPFKAALRWSAEASR